MIELMLLCARAYISLTANKEGTTQNRKAPNTIYQDQH